MKLATLIYQDAPVAAVIEADGFFLLPELDSGLPSQIRTFLEKGPEALDRLHHLIASCPNTRRNDWESVRYERLIPDAEKYFCVGLNYRDHAAENNMEIPSYPVFFTRTANSFVGHQCALETPKVSSQHDFEAELAVVIGRPVIRPIKPEEALEYVGGYTCLNDGSLRDFQFRGPQWTMGKCADKTGSLGPYMVTPDELPQGAKGLSVQCILNGKVMQDGNTEQLAFGVPELIATLSQLISLVPGDVIATGTPGGVGKSRKPPVFLRPGDVCEINIEGIGRLTNTVTEGRTM